MLEFLKGDCWINMPKHLIEKLHDIKKNTTPHAWVIKGSWVNNTALFDFLKSFLKKQDFLCNLVFDRKCEISPILPLCRMYDPLDAITSFLLFYAAENKVYFFFFLKFFGKFITKKIEIEK